jgi:hypothetical protein
VRWLESCRASRSRSLGWKTGSVCPRSAIENPIVRSRFVFEPWQMPHAQGKCTIGAKEQKVLKVPERTDLYWDGDSRERSLDHRCQHATAVLAVACPFCGTQEKCWAGEIVSELCGGKVQSGSLRQSGVRLRVSESSVGDRSASERMRSCECSRACSPLRGSNLGPPRHFPARRSRPQESSPQKLRTCSFSAPLRARVTRRRPAAHRARQRRD